LPAAHTKLSLTTPGCHSRAGRGSAPLTDHMPPNILDDEGVGEGAWRMATCGALGNTFGDKDPQSSRENRWSPVVKALPTALLWRRTRALFKLHLCTPQCKHATLSIPRDIDRAVSPNG